MNTAMSLNWPACAAVAGVSVQTADGQLHPCYSAPYLTGGLVFSRARAPFSHGQLGQHQEPQHRDALALWSLKVKQWRLPAPASWLRFSFIGIKEEQGQSLRAVEASGCWWTNRLLVIQIATRIVEFSQHPSNILFLLWSLNLLEEQKGKEWVFFCGSLAYHLLCFNRSAVPHHFEVVLCHLLLYKWQREAFLYRPTSLVSSSLFYITVPTWGVRDSRLFPT